MVNDIRRVYTDGREHIPVEDRLPIPKRRHDRLLGWAAAGHVHESAEGGIYQRGNPDYTDQVETVEIWQKTDDRTMRRRCVGL
jgi:hypothetical protein